MNNFVYAADTNYNKQLFYSINSLLNNTDTNLNLHIIHKEPVTFEQYITKLQNIFNNFSINLYKFDFSFMDKEASHNFLFIKKLY